MEYKIEMRGICKSFPGVKALDNVSLKLLPGEVMILLGENGAGKSTLMKVLAGVYNADSGEIYYKGKKVDIRSTKDAEACGIDRLTAPTGYLLSIKINRHKKRRPNINRAAAPSVRQRTCHAPQAYAARLPAYRRRAPLPKAFPP